MVGVHTTTILVSNEIALQDDAIGHARTERPTRLKLRAVDQGMRVGHGREIARDLTGHVKFDPGDRLGPQFAPAHGIVWGIAMPLKHYKALRMDIAVVYQLIEGD